jgi:hypothetical protein
VCVQNPGDMTDYTMRNFKQKLTNNCWDGTSKIVSCESGNPNEPLEG